MTLTEALQSAREGNFVSHHSFDYDQSMHYFNGNFYYEDGANLYVNGFIDTMLKNAWSNEDWFTKCSKDMINQEKLKSMHEQFKDKMLPSGRNYNECINRK